jgi:hypothetical protein
LKGGFRNKFEMGFQRGGSKRDRKELMGGLRRNFLMRLEVKSKRIHEEICYGYGYSNTNKTQTPNKLESTDTLLHSTLYGCNDLFMCFSYV